MKSWQVLLLALVLAAGAALANLLVALKVGQNNDFATFSMGFVIFLVVQIVNPALGRVLKRDTKDLVILAALRRWGRARVAAAELRVRYRFDPLETQDALLVLESALDTSLDQARGKNRWKGDLLRPHGYYQADVTLEGDDGRTKAAVVVLRAYSPRAPSLPDVLHDAHAIIEASEHQLAEKGHFRRDGDLMATAFLPADWPAPHAEVQARINKQRESSPEEARIEVAQNSLRVTGTLSPAVLSDLRDTVVLYPVKKK